jgi:tetratricopeptide (TPR) repeat protein
MLLSTFSLIIMPSKHTRLRIVNNTITGLTTSVSGVDGYDWDGGSRPDNNFNGVSIRAMSSEERRAEVNNNAKRCPFTMTLNFQDGSVDIFRINQKYSIDKAKADFNHSRRSHNIYYQRSGSNVLVIRIENTPEQIENEQAEKLNKEAKAAMNNKQFEAALKKLDEALRLAHDTKTIQGIKNTKAENYNLQGQALLQDALNLEIKINELTKAEKMFEESLAMFQKAQQLRHTDEQQRNIELVQSKISANKIFNTAKDVEKKAFEMLTKARKSDVQNDFVAAQDKYKDALNKYKEAKTKFDEGMKKDRGKFERYSKTTAQKINEIKKVIEDIDIEILNSEITKTTVVDNDVEYGDVNTDKKDNTISVIG